MERTYWHAYARGARRLGLFYEASDFGEFLRLLDYARRQSGCGLHAYALMPNHYHLILSGDDGMVTEHMRRLNQMYSRFHNSRHDLQGHTFDGPYHAHFQKSTYLMLCRTAYVLLNPVAGGLAREVGEYPWVSVSEYSGAGVSPLQVDARPILEVLDGDPARARSLFLQLLREQASRHSDKHGSTLVDVLSVQFGWLLSRAKLFADRWPDLAPVSVAIVWGRKAGIPPRVMAAALGQGDSSWIRRTLVSMALRLRSEPELANKIDGGF